MFDFTPVQVEAIRANSSSFLLGPAGTGKSTALRQRMISLLEEGEPAYTLMILVAEPDHSQLFLDALHRSGLGPYAELTITTYTALAREMVTLFWPLVARPAGFARPYQPPTFINYDLAQILMWRTLAPMLEEGAFSNLRLRPQQIVSQLLDTLNRAALNSLSLKDATERQIRSWAGEATHLRHLEDASLAAGRFRKQCLENNLLDLSLAVEVFDNRLVQRPEFHSYFSERFRHLLIDNIEEQTPAGQNFVGGLMDASVSVSIAYDAGGGYKRFMAADPTGANSFKGRCRLTFRFEEPFHSPVSLVHLSNQVENALVHTSLPTSQAAQAILGFAQGRYRQEMVAELSASIGRTIEDGVPPGQIAVIVPYLDGALRYNLTKSFKEVGIPYYLHRRRSSPRDEPRVRAWLTWLALAHPEWGIRPHPFDVAEALTLSIARLDPIRAQLVSQRLYLAESPALLPVSELPQSIAERVGWNLVTLVEDLRLWLEAEGGAHPPDIFLQRLFHGLLAQPRFQPEPDLAGAAVCEWLVRTAFRLREASGPMGLASEAELGRALIDGIYQGLVAATPPELGDPPDPDGVMISTIYGYLLSGYPVEVQVWMETAALGWWDIPRQPLSNAFVLAQSWPADKPWTMDHDFNIRNQLLSRIIRGLTSRCTRGVILASSDLDRRGIRQDGPLWRALKTILDNGVER